jgi:hypothetical protein
VVVHVEDKVLSHDGKTDEADIAGCVWHVLLPKDRFYQRMVGGGR